MIPTWYTDFWCPADMREVDPQGCGIGLGIGLIILLILAAASIATIIATVAYFWPVDKEN